MQENEKETQRIRDMLGSGDPELRRLGATVALEKGPEWCLYNLPPYGHVGNYGVMGCDGVYPRAIKIKPGNDERTMYTKNGVAITMVDGYVMCRLKMHFKLRSNSGRSAISYKIIEL